MTFWKLNHSKSLKIDRVMDCWSWQKIMEWPIMFCILRESYIHFLTFHIHYILFKMSFVWVIYHKVWESYAWSKLSWLFLQNPNLATFGFWWIVSNPWWIMITLDKMMNMTSKSWCWPKILKVDCMLTIIDFLPNIVNFNHLSNWLRKLVMQGMKLSMSIIRDI